MMCLARNETRPFQGDGVCVLWHIMSAARTRLNVLGPGLGRRPATWRATRRNTVCCNTRVKRDWSTAAEDTREHFL